MTLDIESTVIYNTHMDYSFTKGLHDSDGYLSDDGLFISVGKNTMIRFNDSVELEEFAHRILKSLPEIRGEI